MAASTAEILTVPIPPEGLTANQYRSLQKILEDWEEEIRGNASRFPAESYQLGVEQAMAFLEMLGRTGQTDLPPAGRWGPTKRAAVEWQRHYTMHELDGALQKYADRIRSALLYGMRGSVNPTQVASWLYKATRDAEVNWRTVARTEMVRANAAGRLDALEAMGYTEVWAPRHTGACKQCRRLLEDRVFTIAEVRDVTNFGLPPEQWRACIPLHPNCRHVWTAAIPEVFEEAQAQYRALEAGGLDDKTLAEMFDESGQLNPKYENDPRLMNYFEQTGQLGKVADPLGHALNLAVLKAARQEPPGLHHTSARHQCRNCGFYDRPECSRYNWPVDPGEVCASWEPINEIGKGFFDNQQAGLDPLLFTSDERLRADVRDRIVSWWRFVFTDDAPLWSSLYITGSATSRAWEGRRTAGDVDLQVLVDYTGLREHHPEYRVLSDPELHAALVTQLRAAARVGDDLPFEVAPGLALEPFLRPETTWRQFEADVADKAQGVWSVNTGRWVVRPPRVPVVEDVEPDGQILEGEGAALALQHPEWVRQARALVTGLDAAMLAPDGNRGELQATYDLLHSMRQTAFAPGGDGANSLGNFLWRWCIDYGPLALVKHFLNTTPLEKIFPGYTFTSDLVAKTQPAAQGTEHWITIHPNGEDDKGIPVLIRENGDGSATVIGGGGGHLDFLRIETKGRIKPKATKPGQTAEQYSSPEEADAAHAKQEDAAQKAEQVKETAQASWHDSQARIEDLVRAIVDKSGVLVKGEQVGWDDLSGNDRKKLIKQATDDSLFQTRYGSLMDDKRGLAPPGPVPLGPQPRSEKDTGEKPDQKPSEQADTETAEDAEAPMAAPQTRLRIPMSTDTADLLQEELAVSAHARRGVIDANRVINRQGKPVDASDVAWEPLQADRQNAAQKRALLRARELVNSQLVERTENARRDEKGEIYGAIQQGAYDAYDSLLYHVTGATRLSKDATDLLGVNGSAQLAAYMLQQHAAEGELSLDELRRTIDDITDDRQADVTNIGLNRAKHAVAQINALSAEEKNIVGGGDSLTTRTSVIASRFERGTEAAKALGFSIAGSEALHALRNQLLTPVTDLHIGGFVTPGQIRDRASRLGLEIPNRWIHRESAGNYTLKVPASEVASLLQPKIAANDELKDRLSQIRTGQDLDNEIRDAQHPPGYTRELRKVQAQGSLFLRAAKGAVLGFAPGVGKTDTAIGAAMELMAQNPGHRVLIVAPSTALAGAWAPTIQKVAPGKTMQIIGQSGPEEGQEQTFDWKNDSKSVSAKRRATQAAKGADFNIIGIDTLKRDPSLVKDLGHTIMISDELQYAKSDTSQRLQGLHEAAKGCEYRWGLTGTPMEKNVGEYHTMLDWARPGDQGSKQQFTDRYSGINQFDQLTGAERVQQFREATGYGVFYQSQDGSGMPAFPEMQHAHAELTEGHRDAIRAVTREYNDTDREARAARAHNKRVTDAVAAGQEAPGGGYVDVPRNMPVGGYGAIKAALMKPEARGYQGPNMRAQKVADLIAQNQPVTFDGYHGDHRFADGQHAGTYAPKSVVFNSEIAPLESVQRELEQRGTHKVFSTRGGDAQKNQQVLRAFMRHKGPAVLLTTDTNKTAVSLQFGTNNDQFQHGATQMIHTDLPVNNADLEQRIARIWRDGSQAPVNQHWVTSGTPIEQRAYDRLMRERRSLDALGNAEDTVGGRETIGQKMDRRGFRRLRGKKEATDE